MQASRESHNLTTYKFSMVSSHYILIDLLATTEAKTLT